MKSLLTSRLFFSSAKFRLKNEKEYSNINLPVTGTLPAWLTGSLVRNCTVPVYKEGKESTHFFDGISMLHSFYFENGKVCYSSRHLHSETYAKVIQSDAGKAKNIKDAAVNVYKYNDDYVALKESPLPVRFELNNLNTLGNFEFDDDLPTKNTWESAHPHYWSDSKELFNFLIEYGRKTSYVIYKMSKHSSSRKIIARIPVKKPGYMHSFAMTKRYLILVEYPLVANPWRLLFAKLGSFASYIRLFKWQPNQGTRFIVVEKSTGNLVSEINYKAFFSFHHGNAYDERREIVIDLISHNYQRLGNLLPKTSDPQKTLQGLQRFRLNLDEKTIVHENIYEKSIEFPTISEVYEGKNYRYLYMVGFEGNDSSLIKYDWQKRTEVSWQAKGEKIIEPIFVPAPKAISEDSGVLLTVVSDEHKKSSYLLVLDAENMQEIARAPLPELLPTTFHGQFFGQ